MSFDMRQKAPERAKAFQCTSQPKFPDKALASDREMADDEWQHASPLMPD
jgi:hypothetical protein